MMTRFKRIAIKRIKRQDGNMLLSCELLKEEEVGNRENGGE